MIGLVQDLQPPPAHAGPNNNAEVADEQANAAALEDPDASEEPICAICQQALAEGPAEALRCGHCFHSECIRNWVRVQNMDPNNPRCPYRCDVPLQNLPEGEAALPAAEPPAAMVL